MKCINRHVCLLMIKTRGRSMKKKKVRYQLSVVAMVEN